MEVTVYSLLVNSPDLRGPRVTVHASEAEAQERLADYRDGATVDDDMWEIDAHLVILP